MPAAGAISADATGPLTEMVTPSPAVTLARSNVGHLQAQIATALTINTAKISVIERGLAHDNECV